jgi:predicted ABC-type exoprotein transport system permease subunit
MRRQREMTFSLVCTTYIRAVLNRKSVQILFIGITGKSVIYITYAKFFPVETRRLLFIKTDIFSGETDHCLSFGG